MKSALRCSMLSILALVLFSWTAQPSRASTITFDSDDTLIWRGWGNKDQTYVTPWSPQDNTDYIWQPNIIGSSVTIVDGTLTTITMDFEQAWGNSGQGSPWGFLRPADLFIDIGNDGYWDYIFSFDEHYGAAQSLYSGEPAADGYIFDQTRLYKIERDNLLPILGPDETYSDNPITPGTGYMGYIMSNWVDGQGNPDGRVRHPIAFDSNSFDEDIDYTTIDTDAMLTGWGLQTVTYSNLNIELNGSFFTYSTTQNCANDVAMFQVVPEPGTLLLLFMGLGGMVLVRMRFRSRNSG